MTSRVLRGALCLVILSLVLGCASALTEPPPVEGLGGRNDRSAEPTSSADEIIAEADEAFANRLDPAAVLGAKSLYLEVVRSDGAPAEAFLGAARATAWLIEHEPDAKRREALAVDGVQIGQWCGRLHPEVVECRYRLALAVGQQARERPATATDGLDVMVELLEGVIADDPKLDFAGGHRVLALVLLRAPGWPTGPGDPETALDHARRAVETAPDHPPNLLVLGEALTENGRRDEAVDVLERAIKLANDHEGGPDAAEWLTEAKETLAGLR